jgi:hypothetical protein
MSDLERPLRPKRPRTRVDWAVQFRWIFVVLVVLPISKGFDIVSWFREQWSALKSEKKRLKEHDENVEQVIKRLKSRDPAKDGLVCTARRPWIAIGMRNVDYKRARHFEVDLNDFNQVLTPLLLLHTPIPFSISNPFSTAIVPNHLHNILSGFCLSYTCHYFFAQIFSCIKEMYTLCGLKPCCSSMLCHVCGQWDMLCFLGHGHVLLKVLPLVDMPLAHLSASKELLLHEGNPYIVWPNHVFLQCHGASLWAMGYALFFRPWPCSLEGDGLLSF